MSEVIYESVERITKRKVYLLDSKNGETNPTYLESKLYRQHIHINGRIKGKSQEDVIDGFLVLNKKYNGGDTVNICNINGIIKEVEFNYDKKKKKQMPFKITILEIPQKDTGNG